MDKLTLFKSATNLLVGSGTSKITGDIIRNNVTIETTYQKVSVTVAAVVIGSMTAEKTKAYTSDKIDRLVNAWQEAKQKVQEAKDAQ